jgi:hypothetical protein
MTLTNWRKSTYSRAHQNCVEAAAGHALVAARDSQDPDGPVIEVSPGAWTEFTTHVKHATSNTADTIGHKDSRQPETPPHPARGQSRPPATRGPGRRIRVPGISGAECRRS